MQLKIESSDSFGEKYENVYEAKKELGEKGLKYTYFDEYGETIIYIFKDCVSILRKGEIKSRQTLKINEKTKFSYNTPYLSKELSVYTKKLNIEDNKIETSYSIYDGEDLLNDIEMSIKEI